MQRVENRLQVGARPRGKDDQLERVCHGGIIRLSLNPPISPASPLRIPSPGANSLHPGRTTTWVSRKSPPDSACKAESLADLGGLRLKARPEFESALFGESKNRRRPTLPGGCPPSTIGAERLNCSVRNGKRCFPFAMSHRKFCETAPRWSLKTAQDQEDKK